MLNVNDDNYNDKNNNNNNNNCQTYEKENE